MTASIIIFSSGNIVNLVRAVILPASDTRIILGEVADDGITPKAPGGAGGPHNETDLRSADKRFVPADKPTGRFAIWVAQDVASAGADNITTANAKAYVVSLNPSDSMYISNVLNTDPDQFTALKHLLYL